MLPARATLTEEQVRQIVDRFKAYLAEHDIKAAQVAREIKYSPVVVSQWASGVYKGNVTNVTHAINNWMERDARALNAVGRQWMRRKRGTGVHAYTAGVIQYHQVRNAAAMRSRGKLGARLAL